MRLSDFGSLRLAAYVVGAVITFASVAHARLEVELAVEVTELDGLFTYTYTLMNSPQSELSINSWRLTVDENAVDTRPLQQPADWWADFPIADGVNQVLWFTGDTGGMFDASVEDFDLIGGQSGTFSVTSSFAPGLQETTIGKLSPSASNADALEFLGVVVLMTTAPTVPPGSGALACDFDMDADCDVSDIDELSRQISEATTEVRFDLNADGIVDSEDVTAFLTSSEVNKLNGDLDFNGSVEFADFLVLASNFGGPAAWSGGDIVPDGSVVFADFLAFGANFGDSSEFAAVPEPSAAFPNWILLVLTRYMLRKR